jgi:hypothetical protein
MNGKVRIDGLNQPDGSQCPKGPFSSKNTVLSQLQFSFICQQISARTQLN